MLATLLASLALQSAPSFATVGAPLPDVALPDVRGAETVHLSSLRGKRLLLIQFASW